MPSVMVSEYSTDCQTMFYFGSGTDGTVYTFCKAC
jgi:hypothetical protein